MNQTSSILRGVLEIIFLPNKAEKSLNAIIKSIYRLKVSKQNLLEWITSEDAEKQSKTNIASYYNSMKANLVLGLIIIVYGVVNLDISSLYGVVRTFRPYYETNHGRVLNIATALAQMSAPETVERLQQVLDCQGEETVRINYDAREYEIVNSSEVLEHPEVLENKIVLIGMLNDPQDVHITPIGEYTPGLMVHAHALSTILNGDYLTTPPQWVQWMFALLLCICFVLARVFLATYRAGSLLMRLFQVVMLLLVILMGTLLFVHYHLIVELSLPLSLITLAFLTLDVWKGVLGLLNIKNI